MGISSGSSYKRFDVTANKAATSHSTGDLVDKVAYKWPIVPNFDPCFQNPGNFNPATAGNWEFLYNATVHTQEKAYDPDNMYATSARSGDPFWSAFRVQGHARGEGLLSGKPAVRATTQWAFGYRMGTQSVACTRDANIHFFMVYQGDIGNNNDFYGLFGVGQGTFATSAFSFSRTQIFVNYPGFMGGGTATYDVPNKVFDGSPHLIHVHVNSNFEWTFRLDGTIFFQANLGTFSPNSSGTVGTGMTVRGFKSELLSVAHFAIAYPEYVTAQEIQDFYQYVKVYYNIPQNYQA